MDYPPIQCDSTDRTTSTGALRVLERVLLRFGRERVVRTQPIQVPVTLKDHAPVGGAKSGGGLGQRVEHRLQVECRSADDLEHIGGRRLLLKRFTQLAKQPSVFDGDDGLSGKRLQERNLSIRKRSGRTSHDAEQADRLIAAHHGRDRDRLVTTGQKVPGPGGQFGRSTPHVGNIHDPAIEHGRTVHVLTREGGTRNCASPRFGALGITLSDGRGINHIAVPKREADESVRKKLQATLHYGVEYRLGIGG